MNLNILILEPDSYSKEAIQIYEKIGKVNLNLNPVDFEKWDDTHILVCRLGYYLDDGFLRQFPKLEIIACPTTGLNHIDHGYCRKHKITIISLRGEAAFLDTIRSTSELTFALILNLVKNIRSSAVDVIENGHWERDNFKGRELQGMTIGLVGCGRVGTHVAGYAKAFLMNVIAHDPYVEKKHRNEKYPVFTSLEEIFTQSDIVCLHTDYRVENYNMINARLFKMMKYGSYFVNTARGEMVDEEALIWAVEEGILQVLR
jgi:D-3-phosphoglycerate dehydrogenase